MNSKLQSFWAEIRRQEALERLAEKPKSTLRLVSSLMDTDQEETPKRKPFRTKKAGEAKEKSNAKGKTRKTQKRSPLSASTKNKSTPPESTLGPTKHSRVKVQQNCPVCSKEFRVSPSHVGKILTCRSAECTIEMRSRSQLLRYERQGKKPIEISHCLHPDCCNFLFPDKQTHHQKIYCSVGCAARHRAMKKRESKFSSIS